MKKININEMTRKMKSDAQSINDSLKMDIHDEVLNNISLL